jgi:hypothetical protein
VNPALIQLIVLLAPYGVELVKYFIEKAAPTINQLFSTGHDAPTIATISADIIGGIDGAHPDWTPEQRASYAAAAIEFWKEEHTGCAACGR